ncbi:MAG TPA: DinB family protein, partial [Gemmatimonadales bacterium]|nr:DinB family protein [Gemmatimonadales bacterium]
PSDVGAVPTDDVDQLFDLGRRSRRAMRALLAELDEQRWDVPQEIQMGPNKRSITPRTMVAQAVTHEIRHFAQLAAFLRMAGFKTGPHDFLLSAVFEASAPRG